MSMSMPPNVHSRSRPRPNGGGSYKDSPSKSSFHHSMQPHPSSTTNSSISPRPLPDPRPSLPPFPAAAMPADSATSTRKEKSKTLPPEPTLQQSDPTQSRSRTRGISPSSVRGPRERTHSQGTSPVVPTKPFITSTEISHTTGSGSLEKGSSTASSSSTSAKIAMSASSSSPPAPPARSPLRRVKSDDRGDGVSSRSPLMVMERSTPTVNPGPSPASMQEAEVESVGVHDGGDLVKTTRSLTESHQKRDQPPKNSSFRPRLSSASSSSAITRTPSKSKTLEIEGPVTMVISRSQSASASSTTVSSPIGPRLPSSHKVPTVSSSSWTTPVREKLNRHASASASSSQRPSNAASSSQHASLFSTPSPVNPNAYARPSTSASTSPLSTPSPRARGRSGTVVQAPSSAPPASSHSHQPHLLTPSTPPQSHSHLSSPLSSMLSASPLSRSHRSSTASEVSPVHLKRLLAKPADASGSSAYGSGSESDMLKGGSNMFQRRAATQGSDSEGYRSAPGAIGGSRMGRMKGRQRWFAEMQKYDIHDEKTEEIPQLPSLRLVQSLETPLSSPPADSKPPKPKGMSLPEAEKTNEKEKKTRNVLKRRPSTGGFTFLRRPGTSGSVKPSPNILSSPVVQSPVPTLPNLLHSPRLISKSRSPIRNHDREGSGHSSRPPSANSLPPRSLTPAAQLAMAYREQEARRDDLAGSIVGHYPSPGGSGSRSGNTSASASVVSVAGGLTGGSSGHAKEREMRGDDEMEPGTPYYTVLGSTTGRIVAVGNPYDAWGYDVDVPWSRGREKSINAGCAGRRGRSLDGRGKDQKGGSKSGTLSGVGRTLSRKVSGRLRKGSRATAESEGQVDGDGARVTELGELGGPREKGWSFGKSHKRRSLRLSIDKFAFTEDIPLPPPKPLQKPPPPLMEPDPLLAADESRRRSDVGFLNGGKIWKLMKRISSGGLRERYAEAPPPVPALPKELRTTAPKAYSSQDHNLTRFTSQHSSNAEAPLKKHATAVAKLSATGAVVSAPQPSLNTRSSSPVSDELTSLRFFKGTHSSRSSTSSLFEADGAPPLPLPSMISQHIIPPSEFNRADTSEESVTNEKEVSNKPFLALQLPDQRQPTLSSPEEWFIKTPYDEVKPSLPLPPRDRKQPKADSKPRPPSPIIPSFSTAAPINDFPPRRPNLKAQRTSSSPTMSQTQVATVSADMGTTAPLLSTPPPPRPSRSQKRPSPNASASSSRVTSPVRGGELPTPTLRDADIPPDPPPRKSTGSRSLASTFRTGRGRSSSPSSKRKTVVYRELNPVQKSPMLSQKEKDDKWNDLLERSARAGGTLHIGGGDLLSDRLSTITSDSARS